MSERTIEERPDLTPARPRPNAPDSERSLVWVLEDSVQQAEMIELALQPIVDVRLFHDSPELLEALTLQQPDMLILDWKLPDISGLEVLQVLRYRYDEVTLPALMLTGSRVDDGALVEALTAGANDYATKPFADAELRARVSTLVRAQKLHARARRAEQELARALARESKARAEALSDHQKLGDSEERLRRVIEASGAGLWELDIETGRVIADERMLLLMGLTKGASLDVHAGFAAIHPEDVDKLRAAVDVALRGEHHGAYTIDLRTGGRHGVPLRWIESRAQASFDEAGKATRLSGAVVDITARKQAELERETLLARQAQLYEQRQQSEAQLRLVTNAIPLLVSFVTAEETYGYVNKAYEDWFGIPAEQLVGRKVRDVIGEGAYAVLGPHVRRGLAGERFSFEQYGVPYREGGTRDVRVSFVPLTLAEGAASGYVALLEDITAARALESERERLARHRVDDFERQSQFEQQLIGIVSHDLRTPLNVISLSSARIARDEELSANIRKNVVRIQNASERAVRMVSDLLDFTQARLGGGIPIERRSTDLRVLVDKLLAELEAAYPDRQIVFSHHGSGLGEWDPERVSQLAQNLITNALKYSPPDSVVDINTLTEAGWTTLTVHNAGEAIPAHKLPVLFEPLQRGVEQVDRVTRSVGLGLYIVKKIADAHGGTVEVESTSEAGTTFTVRLPNAPLRTS